MRIFGIVIDAENEIPLRGANISLFIGGNELAAIKSDSEGKFEYKETASYIGKTLICKVEKEKYRPHEVSYDIEQEEIRLDIELVPPSPNFWGKFLQRLIQFLRRRWLIITGAMAAIMIIVAALTILVPKSDYMKPTFFWRNFRQSLRRFRTSPDTAIKVYSTGMACITTNSSFDLDDGKWNEEMYSNGNDISYRQDDIERYFLPGGQAVFAYQGNIDFDSLRIKDLISAKSQYSSSKINGEKLTSGAVFFVFTNEKHMSKVRIENPGEYLKMSWCTYAVGDKAISLSQSFTSGPCTIEEDRGCGIGKMQGDEISNFRIVDETDTALIFDVDFSFNLAHGSYVYLGAQLLDENGSPLSSGFSPSVATSPTGKGTKQMKALIDKRYNRPVRTLFIWMYEAYKAECFVCKRFPYNGLFSE